MLLTWGLLAGSILLFAPQSVSSRLQLTYAQVFRWPLEAGRGVTVAARTTSRPVSPGHDYSQLLTTQRQLRNELANLQARLREAQKVNERLAKLRAEPGWENMPLLPLPAGIISLAGQMTINRGQDHGVAVGQYVISPADRCVIGTISHVLAKAATVRLITDSDSKIPISIAGLNVRGIMEGRGDGAARIGLIPDKYAVRPGHRVYAEKMPGLLEAPVVAAEVTACKPDPEKPIVWDITVRPVCDIAGLSDVAVVILSAPTK